MPRPMYETELDRAREESLARVVCEEFDLGMQLMPHRCPRSYPCDWALLDDDNTLQVLLECKVRQRAYAKYMLSLNKVSSMMSLSAAAGASPVLAVYWEDERRVGIVDLRTCSREATMGGRADRGDAQDREPVVMIPYEEFRLVEPRRIV